MSPPSNYRGLQYCRQANNSPRLPTTVPHSLPLLFRCDNASNNAPLEHEKEAGDGGGGEGWTSLCSMAQTTQNPRVAFDASASRAPPPQPPTNGYQLNLELCTETIGCETGMAYAPGDFPIVTSSSSTSRSVDSLLAAIDTWVPQPPTNGYQLNLELCTETLGCETGAAYITGDFPLGVSSSASLSADKSIPDSTGRGMEGRKASKMRTPLEFPPPLTTLSGEDRFRLSSRRVEGRLLLLPYKPNVMEAERRDGRLCLRLFRDVDIAASIAIAGAGDHKSHFDKETSGCDGNVGDEFGLGKYTRAGRCKEEDGDGRRRIRRVRSHVILRCSVASS